MTIQQIKSKAAGCWRALKAAGAATGKKLKPVFTYLFPPTPPRYKDPQQRLEWALGMVAKIEEGHELLRLMREYGVKCYIDERLRKNKRWAYRTNGTYSAGLKEIALNPTLDCGEILITLLHEMTHMQQHINHDFYNQYSLLPYERMLFDRLIEGDAVASSYVLCKKISQATGIKMSPDGDVSPRRGQSHGDAAFIKFQRSSNAKSSYDDDQAKDNYFYNYETSDLADGGCRVVTKGLCNAFNDIARLTGKYLNCKTPEEMFRLLRKYPARKTRKARIAASRQAFKEVLALAGR